MNYNLGQASHNSKPWTLAVSYESFLKSFINSQLLIKHEALGAFIRILILKILTILRNVYAAHAGYRIISRLLANDNYFK